MAKNKSWIPNEHELQVSWIPNYHGPMSSVFCSNLWSSKRWPDPLGVPDPPTESKKVKKSCGSGPPRHIQTDDFNLKPKHEGHHKSCKFGNDQGENQLLLSKKTWEYDLRVNKHRCGNLMVSEKNDPQMMGFHIIPHLPPIPNIWATQSKMETANWVLHPMPLEKMWLIGYLKPLRSLSKWQV